MSFNKPQSVGKLNESNLHNSLKFLYSTDIEKHEQKIGKYHIDVKLENELVEIQTSNLGSIQNKLEKLLEEYRVRLVHPIYEVKYIKKIESDGTIFSRRKSPKKGKLYDCFTELLRIPKLLNNSNFILDILLIEIEELWVNDGKGSWRRKGWSKTNKTLIKVNNSISFITKTDFLKLLPIDLPIEFTTINIKKLGKISLSISQKICYTYSKAGFIAQIGKSGRNKLYQIVT